MIGAGLFAGDALADSQVPPLTGANPSGLQTTVPTTAAGNSLTWDLAHDMQANALSLDPLNPFSDAYGHLGTWELMLSSGTARDPATYSDLNVRTEGESNGDCTDNSGLGSYPSGVVSWTQGPLSTGPYAQATVNTTDATVGTPCAGGQILPPHQVFVHPGPSNDAVIAWHSPINGAVSLSFRASDADCGGGDGIAWYIDRENADIASGSISNCGSDTRLSRPISVNRGTTLYFVIDPKADYSFDLTGIDLTIYRPPVPPSLQPQS
jgi:hypothetical protein